MTPTQVLNEAEKLIRDEKADQAIDLMKGFLRHHDDRNVWWKLATALQITGENVYAQSMMRNVILQRPDPHIVDIIAAGLPYGRPLVFDDIKMVYFAIPKCGSSTIKDAFLVAGGQEAKGEFSHSLTHHMHRLERFDKVQEKYKDYHVFTVVRPPLVRVRSYWQKNIVEAESLKHEAGEKSSYYGLSTAPTYKEILENFQRYRNVFRDFRHHTDSLFGFLGKDWSYLNHIYEMSGVSDAIREISRRSKVDIPTIRNMRSRESKSEPESDVIELEEKVLANFYSKEKKDQ